LRSTFPNSPTASAFVAVAMGVFAFAEIITNVEKHEHREVFTDKVKNCCRRQRT